MTNISETRTIIQKMIDKVLASGGSEEAIGKLERDKLFSHLRKEYYRLVGRSGMTKTYESLVDFLVNHIKFKREDVLLSISKHGIDIEKDEYTRVLVDEILFIVAGLAFEKNLIKF